VQHTFFENHPDAPHHFNTSMMLITAPDLDEAALQAAVRQLLTHHDALRLQFDYDGSSWHQTLTGLPETLPYTRIDLPGATPDAIEARAAEIQASFDLKSGPLFQVVYFRRGGPDTQMPGRLLICLHHLVGDGVSWRVLLEDLVVSYEQARRNLPLRLPSKTTSYQAWANHLVAYARSQALKSEASRWTRIGTLPLQPLPMDHPEGRNTYGSTEEITVSLDRQMTQDLLQTLSTTFGADGEKGPQRTAVEEVLLTALVRAFAPWTGTRRLLIEMEGHGREEIAAGLDLSRTVGWFTSIYPVLIDLEEVQDLASQLRVARQQLQAVPHRGIDYGVLRYLCDDSELRRQMAALPTPQVNFNYLGQVVPAAAGDELEQTLFFGLAPESPGPEQSPSAARSALLYVVGIVTDGSLDMRWLYSREVFERSTIELVANTTMNELRAIIGGSTAGHADKALQSGQGGNRHG
jgi:non-ribosomal peptide synthase protein (TIGR01720 family)